MRACNRVGKPVLILSQILESMVANKVPNRTEVVDIQQAIENGVDTIILSPETAIGPNGEEAVQMLSSIIIEAEKQIDPIKRYLEMEKEF